MNGKVHIGFALFGLGRAGTIHANNIIRNPQARLKYIVDIDENKAKEFVESNLLETKVVPPSEVETVLNDPSVTAAVITTPTHLHEDLVVSSLKAGKAVLCEKPVATTMEAIGLYFRLVYQTPGVLNKVLYRARLRSERFNPLRFYGPFLTENGYPAVRYLLLTNIWHIQITLRTLPLFKCSGVENSLSLKYK